MDDLVKDIIVSITLVYPIQTNSAKLKWINCVVKTGRFIQGHEIDLEKFDQKFKTKILFQSALICQFHQTNRFNVSINNDDFSSSR